MCVTGSATSSPFLLLQSRQMSLSRSSCQPLGQHRRQTTAWSTVKVYSGSRVRKERVVSRNRGHVQRKESCFASRCCYRSYCCIVLTIAAGGRQIRERQFVASVKCVADKRKGGSCSSLSVIPQVDDREIESNGNSRLSLPCAAAAALFPRRSGDLLVMNLNPFPPFDLFLRPASAVPFSLTPITTFPSLFFSSREDDSLPVPPFSSQS